jgi:hypothetical protein
MAGLDPAIRFSVDIPKQGLVPPVMTASGWAGKSIAQPFQFPGQPVAPAADKQAYGLEGRPVWRVGGNGFNLGSFAPRRRARPNMPPARPHSARPTGTQCPG